jgi:hypothetical protein
MPKYTRNLRDLAAHLRNITDLIESADLGELPADVDVSVQISTDYSGYGEGEDDRKRAAIDVIAQITGTQPDYNKAISSGKYGYYQTQLTGDDEPWQLRASAYVKKPDPQAAMEAELEQLRARVAELTSQFPGSATMKIEV